MRAATGPRRHHPRAIASVAAAHHADNVVTGLVVYELFVGEPLASHRTALCCLMRCDAVLGEPYFGERVDYASICAASCVSRLEGHGSLTDAQSRLLQAPHSIGCCRHRIA